MSPGHEQLAADPPAALPAALAVAPGAVAPAAVTPAVAGVGSGSSVRRRVVDVPTPVRRALGSFAAPVAVYLLGQCVGVLAVTCAARASSWPLVSLLEQWDAQFYLAIARSGYSVAGPLGQNLYAFFPGYPLAVRGVAHLTGLGVTTCAVIVSLAAGIVLACGIDRLTSRLLDAGRSLRLTAVFLVAVLPLSAVFLMPYTEALFCALAVWALVWAGRGRWLAAGLCACAAGLVRPTGVAVVVAMAVGAASTWRQGDPQRWRAVAGCALAPLGTVGFLVWASLSTGRPDAWLHAEASGWGTTFDMGAHFAGYLFLVVVHGAIGPVDVAVVGAAAACAVAIARMRRRHLPGEVVAYVVGVLVLAVGTAGVWNSKYRIMMPALMVAAVLAAGPVSRLRPPARAALLVAVAAAGCWFSAYAIIAYPHAI